MNEQPGILDASAQARIVDYIDSRPINRIIFITAAYFDLKPQDIVFPDRHRRMAWPRMAAMAFTRKYTTLTFPAIGRRFRRNHTTVLSACRRFEVLRSIDAKFRADTDAIETLILHLIGTAGGTT